MTLEQLKELAKESPGVQLKIVRQYRPECKEASEATSLVRQEIERLSAGEQI